MNFNVSAVKGSGRMQTAESSVDVKLAVPEKVGNFMTS
jgi:hypothetical protein